MKKTIITVFLFFIGFKGYSQEYRSQNLIQKENISLQTVEFPVGDSGVLDVIPKVENREMFINDMKFAIKKEEKRWKPALKNGKAVVSKKVIKINFTTDHIDYGV